MRLNFLICLLLATLTLSAQSKSKNDPKKQREELMNDVKKKEELKSQNDKSIRLTLNQISSIDGQIRTCEESLSNLQEEVSSINNQIDIKEQQISELEKNLQVRKKDYAALLRQSYQQKRNSEEQWLFLLSAGSLSQSVRRMMFVKKYSQHQRQQLEKITTQQEKMNVEKQDLLQLQATAQGLAAAKQKEEQKLEREKNNRQVQVDKLRKNNKQLLDEIEKKKKQADALQHEIDKMRQEAKKTPQAERKQGTQRGFSMTKEEEILSSNFSANKGKLPFPLKGAYRITGHFGQHRDPGIKIETNSGNTARAIFDGEVLRVAKAPNYQYCIFVKHGDYCSFYVHIEQVFVKQGDKVKTGQELGRIYTDAIEGAVLVFELWKLEPGEKDTKLNPELWLKK